MRLLNKMVKNGILVYHVLTKFFTMSKTYRKVKDKQVRDKSHKKKNKSKLKYDNDYTEELKTFLTTKPIK